MFDLALLVINESVIIDHHLHAPFRYLLHIREGLLNPDNAGHRSQAALADDELVSTRFERRSRLVELELNAKNTRPIEQTLEMTLVQ